MSNSVFNLMKDTCLVKISLRLTSPEPLNMKKMTTFFTIVEQNAEITGPSDKKFSKPPLKELDEALELLSD